MIAGSDYSIFDSAEGVGDILPLRFLIELILSLGLVRSYWNVSIMRRL